MKNRLNYKNIPSLITILILLFIISNQHFKILDHKKQIGEIQKITERAIKISESLHEKNNQLKIKHKRFIQEKFMLKVTLTAYTNSVNETNKDNKNTALMEIPKPGWSIAVSQDLSYLLGRKVYIEGIGVRYVNDLMNKRYIKRADILVPTKKMARNFGVKKNRKLILID